MFGTVVGDFSQSLVALLITWSNLVLTSFWRRGRGSK